MHAGVERLGPPGEQTAVRTERVHAPARRRHHDVELAVVLEVSHGDVAEDRLVPRMDAPMSSNVGERIRVSRPAGRLVPGVWVDRVHEPVRGYGSALRRGCEGAPLLWEFGPPPAVLKG